MKMSMAVAVTGLSVPVAVGCMKIVQRIVLLVQMDARGSVHFVSNSLSIICAHDPGSYKRYLRLKIYQCVAHFTNYNVTCL